VTLRRGLRRAIPFLRIDNAHLATQYVDELRQGFNARPAEELAELRRLAGPCRQRAFRIGRDRAEAEHLKTATHPVRYGCAGQRQVQGLRT
jgi:hypothetical protein